MSGQVIAEVKSGVGYLTLDAPRSLNSLTVPMLDRIQGALTEWREDDGVKCVFLQGAGEKAFCAGGDVRRLREAVLARAGSGGVVVDGEAVVEAGPRVPPAACVEFFSKEYRADHSIHRFPKPVVVWGGGIVMGGGIGLLAGASHRVVTERTLMAMPEISIGLFPDVGGTWFLNRMPPGWGAYIALTGARFSAGDALYVGLADHFASSESKDFVSRKLRSLPFVSDPGSNGDMVTDLLKEFSGTTPASPMRARAAIVAASEGLRTPGDFRRYFAAAAESDEWFAPGVETFDQGSPSSAAVIVEQLRRGKDLSLEEVFRSELNLAVQCCLRPDFAEGVRALLVDKDRAPKWRPSGAAVAAPGWIAGYFRPLWAESDHPLRDLREG